MTKGLPPSATEIAFRRRKLKLLSRNVRKGLNAKGWDQSALARECWGEYTNPRTGKVSARSRDIISKIVREISWPQPHNLAQIASALGTTPEELAGETVEPEGPDYFAMTGVGDKDKVRLKLNKLVSMNIATQIMALLNGAQESG